MATDLFITFDVENRADKVVDPDDMVLGQADDGRFGPVEIAEALHARDLRGTFFIDILDDQVSPSTWSQVGDAVLSRGSSLALHTHGEWLEPGWKGLTGGTLEKSRHVIHTAVKKFEETFGRKPLVHRAGWLKMDPAIYPDLRREGILVDSTPTHLTSCPLREHFVPNVVQRRADVSVVPVTNYDCMPVAPLSHLRVIDPILATPGEFTGAVKAVARDPRAVVVTLTHSFFVSHPTGERNVPALAPGRRAVHAKRGLSRRRRLSRIAKHGRGEGLGRGGGTRLRRRPDSKVGMGCVHGYGAATARGRGSEWNAGMSWTSFPEGLLEKKDQPLRIGLPDWAEVGVVLSHDVDHLGLREHLRDSFLFRQSADILLQNTIGRFRPLRALRGAGAVLLTPFGLDVWRTLPQLLARERAAGVSSTYFFPVAKGRGIAYGLDALRDAVTLLREGGRDVQLHGQHPRMAPSIGGQSRILRDITGEDVLGTRMHYLAMDEEVMGEVRAAGLRYDSSFMLRDVHASSAENVFHPFWAAPGVVEIPLNIMDNFLFSYRVMGLDLRGAKAYTETLLDTARESRGVVTINLHPNYYSVTHPDFRDWYDWILGDITSRPEVWVGSCADYLGLVE